MTGSFKLVFSFVAVGLILLAPANASASLYHYGTYFNLPIPADQAASGRGLMNDALFAIPDHHIIKDLDISIGITHPHLADLEIILTSPAGTRIMLMPSGIAAFSDTPRRTTLNFDDSAALYITQLTQLTQPVLAKPVVSSSLSVFNGQDAIGTWHIRIADYGDAFTGTLDFVRFTISNPEPCTISIMTLGLLLSFNRKHLLARK